MEKTLRTIALGLLLSLAAAGCNRDAQIELDVPMTPQVILDSETSAYTVKRGRELTIAPAYRYVEGAIYTWSRDGRIVGQEPAYTFSEEATGRYYVALEVATRYGTAREEIRIEVAELALPVITLPGAAGGFSLITGMTLDLAPTIAATGLETRCEWALRRPAATEFAPVSAEAAYTFAETAKGEYAVRFTAENEDGADSVEFSVTVADADDLPFEWSFPQRVCNMAAGRTIRLQPQGIRNAFDAEYTWCVDGREVQRSAAPACIFTSADEGEHRLTVTMTNSYRTCSEELTVNVCPAEGRYYRPRSGSSSARWNRIYEFTPAPGQFINEGYSAATPEAACTYAESRLKAKAYLSLGAFGGYLVAGFDHSIDATGGYDFAIGGNSFDTCSEPGIVWVMQDENGDGLPNDTWYELAGSETGKEETLQDYAVTYYRPRTAGSNIPWADNLGRTGTVDINNFHRQDYWPAWITADQYTLTGTCLKERNYDRSGNGSYWVQPAYDWGYADNFSPIDRLTADSNQSAGMSVNHFRIADAIDFAGRPVALQYIDFVKIQTGTNAKSGWLGENSTEVLDIFDYSMTDE